MELIPNNLSIDFVGKRRLFIIGSLIVNLAIILGIAIWGLRWGVDFAGGSEIELKFAAPTSPVDVRKVIEEAGLEIDVVQEIGSKDENSFLVRINRISLMSAQDAAKVEASLKQKLGGKLIDFNFNQDYGDKVELRFSQTPPAEEVRGALEAAGVKVQELRDVPGGFTVITAGISEKVASALQAAEAKGMPKAELRRIEFVGPQVGKQLRNKGIFAVVWAALAILAYIAFRFDTRFAPGAVLAMLHDIIIVIGYYLVTRREFNLTSVAVLLTIVGYSVNDTIVIYDRIRENLAKLKGMELGHMINISVNETLSRTIITGLTSMLALAGLLFLGIGQLFDFAAAMIIGVAVGTYSSIYIASPMTIWLDEVMGRKQPRVPAAAAKAG